MISIAVLDLFVLREIAEALFLDAGDVEHVGVLDDVGDVVGLAHVEAPVDEFVHQRHRQAQDFRRDEAQADVVVLHQQAGERVDGASVAQVADHRDLQAINVPQFLADGEQVEQRLGGMFARAVARR